MRQNYRQWEFNIHAPISKAKIIRIITSYFIYAFGRNQSFFLLIILRYCKSAFQLKVFQSAVRAFTDMSKI